MPRSGSTLIVTISLLLGACSSNSGQRAASTAPDVSASLAPLAGASPDSSIAAPVPDPLPCDPIDPSACLLPWPNDAFTKSDSTTATGRRLALASDAPPKNASGKVIDVTDQNRADGFSPGSAILVHVPEIDLARTGIAASTAIGKSLDVTAPILLIDATTGTRWPYWAELDAHAVKADQRLLMVHPAAALLEGHRYVVALQHLASSSGALTAPNSFTEALTDATTPGRSAHLVKVVNEAVAAGADKAGLYMAWDFTIASAESLAGRLRHIRDDAYASVGAKAPVFTVTSHADEGGVRKIDGTFAVPNYLTGVGAPGSTFELGTDGLPVRNVATPDYAAPFLCLVPTNPKAPTPVVVYGHGLLGSRQEVNALRAVVAQGLLSICGSDWIGMSTEDIGNLAGILGDMSNFRQQADRMQQGLLNMQFLGRAINAANGFVADASFQTDSKSPLIASGKTTLLGNSQGGILGGAASAISTEWTNVVLGVPGIDYSLLLPRSSDWPEFESVFNVAYTGDIDRVLTLQLAQLLWDRGENDGYAQHLTQDTYAGITAKKVLMIGAFGDHQVSNVSTDMLARTIHAGVHSPGLRPGRSKDEQPFFGITPITDTTVNGSILVPWDYATPAPPTVNLPPTEPEYGEDPHGKGSSEPRVIQSALTFLLTGVITVPCNGPCVSDRVP